MQPLDRTAMTALRMLLATQPLTDAKIGFAWTVAAGPALSRAATVSRLAKGGVVLRASSEPWRREIERALPVIRRRMAELLGPGVVDTLDVVPPLASPQTRGRARPRS